MQRNPLCSSELFCNIIKGATFSLRQTNPGEGEGRQSHSHEQEVDVLATDFLKVKERKNRTIFIKKTKQNKHFLTRNKLRTGV